MKKQLLILMTFLSFFIGNAQNAIVGTGFAGAWPASCNLDTNAKFFAARSEAILKKE
jgi:hypothetical protein